MAKKSAGILLYRKINRQFEFFLVHPGGPYFKNKDLGVWSIPKGEYPEDEEPLAAAKREFFEETGQHVDGDFILLAPVTLKSGKIVHAWALEGDIDPAKITSNLFEMEWPPKSGKMKSFPEIDRADWFDADEAKIKINGGQASLIDYFLAKQ
ncbi:NUDIX domain-containing protein [Mucilaginibacter gotjawali]|uniref:NUDIX domain protein n=2 Tax=Mucilaginibacter gotjawali TaxID=1550579 RepID=A0A0X8X5L0_9SPHI|nr:NUDIX domain-containing protein [Mucilaginibacter gotjawali]MBB3053720.1 putative NUDIX family NTP pyrophosphohydrolase [Mucilaginibacter gotjawali]BAU53979.1 NUDIX domain protein [Mucilaginibacter gotjawali]